MADARHYIIEGLTQKLQIAEARIAELERERDEAYERAAQVAERSYLGWGDSCHTGAVCDLDSCEQIAAAIRALAGGL